MRSVLVVAVLVFGCGAPSVYEAGDVGASCDSSVPCPAISECAMLLHASAAICVLLRKNGEHCPSGGISIAWGTTTVYPDGRAETDAHFGCMLSCTTRDECPSSAICADGMCE